MKLVLHDKTEVVTIFENIENLRIQGRELSWTGGSIGGLKEDMFFILVPDETIVKRGDAITDELLSKDVISESGKVVPTYDEVIKENRLLRARVDSTESAMINIIDMLLEQNPLALDKLGK